MKKPVFWSTIIVAAIAIATANAQTPEGPTGPQMRGDGPPPEAKLIEPANGFGLTEAGLWIREGNSGYWIFAGLLDNVLYKVTPDKKVTVFMEQQTP